MISFFIVSSPSQWKKPKLKGHRRLKIVTPPTNLEIIGPIYSDSTILLNTRTKECFPFTALRSCKLNSIFPFSVKGYRYFSCTDIHDLVRGSNLSRRSNSFQDSSSRSIFWCCLCPGSNSNSRSSFNEIYASLEYMQETVLGLLANYLQVP